MWLLHRPGNHRMCVPRFVMAFTLLQWPEPDPWRPAAHLYSPHWPVLFEKVRGGQPTNMQTLLTLLMNRSQTPGGKVASGFPSFPSRQEDLLIVLITSSVL